jgi:cysteine desulfurase
MSLYLDYAASTPVDPQVVSAMHACLSAPDGFANPASNHARGRAAAARIEHARTQVAALLGAAPREVYFTSGATESNNLAVLGVARAQADRGRHIVSSRIEHKSVLDACHRLEREGFRVTYLTPDSSGRIDPQALRAALRPDTVLASIMHVNNEIGVVQEIESLGAICRAHGVLFHTDAAQSVGRLAIDLHALPVDLLSFTAHKLYGPKGVGALYVQGPARTLLQPLSFGGGQEGGVRPGTLPTHQIVGLGAACELAAQVRATESERIAQLRDRLWAALAQLGDVHLNGAGAVRVANILNVSFEHIEGESLLNALPALEVSTGSACNSAMAEPSYVLRALGRTKQLAESSLRFSVGRYTSAQEIDEAAASVCTQVRRLRRVSPWASACADEREVSAAPPGAATPAGAPLEHSAADALTPLTRALFDELPGAGAGRGLDGTVIEGEAGGPESECWVRFFVQVAGDTVKDARFLAFGCPHTLAAAAWVAGRLRGRQRCEGPPGAPAEWAQMLGAPVEKLGRLMVVEDAVRSSLQHWP